MHTNFLVDHSISAVTRFVADHDGPILAFVRMVSIHQGVSKKRPDGYRVVLKNHRNGWHHPGFSPFQSESHFPGKRNHIYRSSPAGYRGRGDLCHNAYPLSAAGRLSQCQRALSHPSAH